MFEKIGRAAETMATRAGQSRRGFLARCVQIAGGVAVTTIPLILPSAAFAADQQCNAPWKCKCKNRRNYGCAAMCQGCSNQANCENSCYVFCYQSCSGL